MPMDGGPYGGGQKRWNKKNAGNLKPRGAGIISAAHLLLALEDKTPYDCECCVRVSSGKVAAAVAPGPNIDTYCGPTALVPRIWEPLHPGGLCMSAVN